jgi:hypothetical protein
MARTPPTSNEALRLKELAQVLNRPAVVKQRVLSHAAEWRLPLLDDGGLGFWIAVHRTRAMLPGVDDVYQAESRQWLQEHGVNVQFEVVLPQQEVMDGA